MIKDDLKDLCKRLDKPRMIEGQWFDPENGVFCLDVYGRVFVPSRWMWKFNTDGTKKSDAEIKEALKD